MSVTENLLEYNRGYAERFAQGGLPAKPARGAAVVTCMDARVHPEYLVIHHTKCGLLGAANDALRAGVAAATGADASAIDFLPFDDMTDSVRDDVRLIRASPYLPADATVSGYVFDVDTAALSAV